MKNELKNMSGRDQIRDVECTDKGHEMDNNKFVMQSYNSTHTQSEAWCESFTSHNCNKDVVERYYRGYKYSFDGDVISHIKGVDVPIEHKDRNTGFKLIPTWIGSIDECVSSGESTITEYGCIEYDGEVVALYEVNDNLSGNYPSSEISLFNVDMRISHNTLSEFVLSMFVNGIIIFPDYEINDERDLINFIGIPYDVNKLYKFIRRKLDNRILLF